MVKKPTYEELEQRIKELEGQRSGHLGLDLTAIFQGCERSFPVGITDHKGVVLYVNHALVEMWGYSNPEDIIGQQLTEFWEGPGIYRTIEDLATKGWSMGEDIGKRKDDSLFPVEYRASMCNNIDGKPLYMLGQFFDISDRKLAEKQIKEARIELENQVGKRTAELRKTTEQLNALMNATTDTALLIDLKGYVVAANAVTAKRLGITQDQLLGTFVYDLMPPSLVKSRKAKADRVVKTGKPCRLEDERGGIVLDSMVYPVFDEGGKVVQLAIYGKDITKRKQAEEALRKSEEHHRSFMESAKGFLVYRLEVDTENYFSGRLVFVSSGIQDLIGISPEADFSEWFNSVHPDDLPELIEAQAKSVRNGDTFDQEFRWKNLKGEWGWCHAISNPVFDSEGNPKYFNGMIIDVTPQKQAEKALQESEGHLRSLMESASNFAVYRLISDGDNPNLLRVIFVSPSITDIMGVSEPMSFGTWFEHIHPDDVERIVRANIEAFKTLRFDETMRIYHSQKQKWVWIHAISTGFEDHERQCKYVNGILIDITRQKEAERALQESEQRMDLAMEGGDIGLWDWNLRTGEVFFDRRWHESLGYSPGEVELNPRTWEKIIHPEDWPRMQQAQKDNLRGKIPFYEKEARMKCKSGQWRWMLTRAKIMERDSNGKALRITGTHQDINDRKLMEIKLQIKTLELEETNTALKILLNHREKDKEELGEKVLSNVKSLVEPYLKELKDSRVDQRQIVFLGLLESGLKNILSSFSSKLSSKYLGLTPGELQVAYLIKEGKRTKEIAELLNLSGKTIEDYRKNLRKKLGIRNMKVNLRTHLLSIQK